MKTIYQGGSYTLEIEQGGQKITFKDLKLTAKQAKEALKTGQFAGLTYKELSLNS